MKYISNISSQKYQSCQFKPIGSTRPRDLTPQAYSYIHILTENGKKTQF